MDIATTLLELYDWKRRLEAAISTLEELNRSSVARDGTPKRRGRKSMAEAERKQVAERMRRYWAGRRKSKAKH